MQVYTAANVTCLAGHQQGCDMHHWAAGMKEGTIQHLSVFEVVEAASGLFRSGQLFGSHLVTLLSLGLLLALLAGLNAMKPAWPTCFTRSTQSMQ